MSAMETTLSTAASPKRRGWIASLLVASCFAATCAAVYPLMDTFGPQETGALLVYACFGTIAASAALLAIGIALVCRPPLVRLLAAAGGSGLLFGFWTIGFMISNRLSIYQADTEWRLAVVILLCLPLGALAVTAPLYLMRLAFGWRLVERNGADDERGPSPTLRDLLLAMGLIALAFAGARLAGSLAQSSGGLSEVQFWVQTGVALGICVVLSAVTTLPLTVVTLRSRWPALALAGFAVFAALVLVAIFGMLRLLNNQGILPTPSLSAWDVVGITVSTFAFLVSAATPLLLARRGGWRLDWGRQTKAQEAKA